MLSRTDADLVRRDREVPDLVLLLHAEALAARLARTCTHASIDDVIITYLRYKPGQGCVAGCRARVDGCEVDFVAETYRRDDADKFRKAVARRSVGGPFGSGSFVLADSQVLVSAFPNDRKLERLARLTSAEGIDALVARLGGAPGAAVRLDALRYNPQRRFVGRLMSGETPLATVRCYTARDYPAVVTRAGVLTSRGPLRLAKRLTRMHRFCLLGFEWLPGDLLDDAIVQRRALPEAVAVVGDALAQLHRQEGAGLPRRTNASEAGAVMALARQLAFLYPPIENLIRRAAERIAAHLPADGGSDIRPLHGDFYAQQVLLAGSRAALIDLDEASLGDPAVDLARFRADLEARVVSGRLDRSIADEVADRLLAGYSRTLRVPAHLQVHAAAQLFRLAAHPFRRRESSWAEIGAAILERAGSLIEKVPATRAGSTNGWTGERSSRPRGPHTVGSAARCRVIDPFGVTRDARMPCLVRALAPEAMAERFARALCGPGPGRSDGIDVLRIEVTRHKPGLRCLIAYDLASHQADGTRLASVMGKVRAQSADTSTHELLETLWTGAFGPGRADGILVPEPLGVVSDLHMIVQRRVAGEPLGAHLGGPRGRLLAGRAADAIHRLHRTSAPARRRHTVDDELRILRQRLSAVAQTRPHDRARIERLLDGCVRLAEQLRGGTVCGIHRDFYPDQLLVDGERLYLTDLDLYSEGPPGLDVGNFAAHVTEYSLRRFGDPEALADRNEALIARYLQLSRWTTRQAIDAWTTLSLVRHVAISTQFADREPFTAAILDLCEQRLFGEAAAARRPRRCEPAQGVRR